MKGLKNLSNLFQRQFVYEKHNKLKIDFKCLEQAITETIKHSLSKTIHFELTKSSMFNTEYRFCYVLFELTIQNCMLAWFVEKM